MKEKLNRHMKPVLFMLGGVAVGFLYYYFIGCASGTCPLTSNPYISMAYMGVVGWLLSCSFGKRCI